MIYEFLRYYSNMGFKLLVYDRDGANMKDVFSGSYPRAIPLRGRSKDSIYAHVAYHNYTIQSLLMPTGDRNILKSDMESRSKHPKNERSVIGPDNDKVLTYTHCRFEAMYKYGIKQVIVADFDEFLYCKAAPRTAWGQSYFISELVARSLQKGYDQLLFGKTTVSPKQGDKPIHQCISREVEKTLNVVSSGSSGGSSKGDSGEGVGSIFNCFASLDYPLSTPNMKSVHLNHACPYTGIHHACSPTANDSKAYDCTCQSDFSSTCDFVHLSLVQQKYKPNGKALAKLQAAASLIEQSKCELWYVANSNVTLR